MRLIASMLLMFAAVGSAGAQTNGPQVDQAEVLRLGNMVQVVGDGLRASPDTDAYVAAMGPPAGDVCCGASRSRPIRRLPGGTAQVPARTCRS